MIFMGFRKQIILAVNMLRLLIIFLIITLSVLCFIGLFYKLTSEPIPSGKLPDIQFQFNQIPNGSKIESHVKLPEIVKEINSRIERINSLSCDNLEVKIWQNGHRFKLTGSLYSENPQNFRMQIESIFGKELDIGSNDKLFWYWSRRDKKPGLHYAYHQDFNKTRLKTPFNPMFLRNTLGTETIKNKDCKIVENNQNIMLSYPFQRASIGEPVFFSIFVNKARKQVTGYLVADKNGKTIASCEIQEYSGDIPVKILYTWYEEDKILLIHLRSPKLNPTLSPTLWVIPDLSPKINMAEESF